MNTGGPSPRSAVWAESVRSLGTLALSPVLAAGYWLRHIGYRQAVRRDLDDAADVDEGEGEEIVLPARPLKLFVSCAEPSGEAHGVNLVHALRTELARRGAPEPELLGLGSARLADLGVRTVGDPVERAAMGTDAIRSLPFYTQLLRRCARVFADERPDAVIPIDSPALHVPLGRIAHRYGVPVVHFVTPQYWGWAPWRVGAYRKAVDNALTILPFEPAWFRRHGVRSAHVGHPHLDALNGVPAPDDARRETLVLLPGSRASVIARNLPWMLVTAARTRLDVPELEVVLPHDRPELRSVLEQHVSAAGATEWVRIAAGGLHAELARARAALSVSGTILIDLLHHRLPCAVIYRLGNPLSTALARHVLTVPWFASINLVAGRELVPEHCFHGNGPVEEVGRFLSRCLLEEGFRAEIQAGMDEVANRLGPPGATARAARHALAVAGRGLA